jgi:DNA-binding CsgD family transcriptional regulator/tetratricopeptide (TPR) repeat protein
MDLLEREGPLQRLGELVEQAGDGEGRISLIRGEAGIGKTSVVRALTHMVADQAHVLWGSCDDLLAPRPLGPIVDMSFEEPRLVDALTADDSNSVLSTLMELFTRALRPTIAVFEDVHWADGATLDLLTSLGRRIDRTHTLLVMTFREKIPASHQLGVVLGDLPKSFVENIELEPLSQEAVHGLAGDEDLANRVWDLSDGNPFLVTELLRHTQDEVSTSVMDTINSQVMRLTAKGERLVKLTSVVPRRLELDLLDEIDPGLHESIGEAEDAGLLELTADALTFRHELARTAVEASLTEPLRRELHLEMLAAGERLGLDSARLAHHARLAVDVDAMVRWLPDAAKQAAAKRSHREVIALMKALEPHLEMLPIDLRADLIELWAAEEQFTDGEGLQHAMAAVALRRQLGDATGVGTGLVRASRSAWAGADFVRAAELAEEAVDVLEHVGGEGLALAYAQLARVAAQNLDQELGLQYSEQALALAPDPSQARALALATAGVCKNIMSYPDGSEMLVEAADIAESLGLAWELQRARGNLIETALSAKDIERAQRLNESALTSIDHDIGTSGWHLMMAASISAAIGDYEAAEPALNELVDRDRLPASLRWFSEGALAELLVRRGAAEAGLAVKRLWDRAHTFGQIQDLVQAATVSAEYHWVYRQRDDRAAEQSLEIFEHTTAGRDQWAIGEHALWLWLDGHLDAVPDQAAPPVRWLGDNQWERAAEWFADRGVPFEHAVALSLGGPDARLEALRVAQRIGARALAARIRNELRADGVTGIPRGPRQETRGSPLGLTPRQDEVLTLLAEGLSNAEIADRLFISLRTVENHVSAILAKLGVAKRDEALVAAVEAGELQSATQYRD